MIYDRPVSDLMHDAAKAQNAPFSVNDLVNWFEEGYPRIKPGTVRAHVLGLTSNSPSRHHYPTLASRVPLFVRREDGLLDIFDPDIHIALTGDGDAHLLDDTYSEEQITEQAAEFVLESQLEIFLLTNWNHINWGRPLQIWQGANGQSGNQLSTPIGRLDLLCRDTVSNALVVVELKRGQPSDRVVGQLARYIGYVKAHIADPGQSVEGLIVAHETDDALGYAVSALVGVSVMTYQVKFELRPVVVPNTGVATMTPPARYPQIALPTY